MRLPRLFSVKRAPCSRAARIRRRLRRVGSIAHTRPSKSSQQVLQDILKVLMDTSGALSGRLEQLYKALEKLPRWTEWSTKEDTFIAPALQEFMGIKDEEKVHSERILAEELVRQNGNTPYLEYKDLTREDGPFMFLYTQWLTSLHSPQSVQHHIQTDDGQWVNDATVRKRLRDGWKLHIPSRTLRPGATRPFQEIKSTFTHSPMRPRSGAICNPPASESSLTGDPARAHRSLLDEIRDLEH